MAVVLVTGADKGIGRALAVQFNARGDKVIAMCLGDGKDLEEMGMTVEPNVDVTKGETVDAMAARIAERGDKIDVLLNNAGVLGVDTLGSIDYDDVRRQFEINAIGPLRVTEALAPHLNDGGKVGIITSRVGSCGDNSSGGMYAYRMSKSAANMAGVNLFHDLKGRDITVILLHPGMVATDLTKGFEADFISPETAAEGLIKQVDEATMGDHPEFHHANGELLPW